MYRLSQISGVPKTTIVDICSGKSSISGCSAKTVYKLAKALECTMEELLEPDTGAYDAVTGLPKDETYLERGLPSFLETSIAHMEESWRKEDRGETDLHWDCYWCELNADINAAEVNGMISHQQATCLRKKYLRMEDSEC